MGLMKCECECCQAAGRSYDMLREQLRELEAALISMQKSASSDLKPKTYVILRRAIEEGVAQGYRYAHKHTSTPGEAHTMSCIEDAVMGAIDEVFEFPDNDLIEEKKDVG